MFPIISIKSYSIICYLSNSSDDFLKTPDKIFKEKRQLIAVFIYFFALKAPGISDTLAFFCDIY